MRDRPNHNDEPILRRRTDVRSFRRRDGLLQFASNVTSQNGEDGILRRIFRELDRVTEDEYDGNDDGTQGLWRRGTRRTRYAVDVGAWDGKHLSNTYSLFFPEPLDLYDNTNDSASQESSTAKTVWTGILIEANPERFKELEKLHRAPRQPRGDEEDEPSPHDEEDACQHQRPVCLCRCVSVVPDSPDGLDALLREHGPRVGLPYDFDVLCVDVDGGDYHLWRNLLESSSESSSCASDNDHYANSPPPRRRFWRPKVVCIEFNPTMPNDLVYIPPANDSIRHGASLAALVELGSCHEYVLVETTLYNAIFVTKTLYETTALKELVPDTSIEALHEVTMGTAMYQLYDGTIKLHGCKKLLWHRVPIPESKLQVLPSHQRHYPFAPPPSTEAATATTTATATDSAENGPELHRPNSALHSADAPTTSTWEDSTPVVDVRSWCIEHGTTTECDRRPEQQRQQCSRQLLEKLLQQGFCHVRGTGMRPELCRRALEVSRQFLHDLPEEARKNCLAKDRARRGYSPPGTENFASLIGETSPNDLVRKFRIGPPAEGGFNVDSAYSSLLQPNVWPDPADWDGAAEFQSVMEAYYREANRAANRVVQAVCAGLRDAHPDLEESLRPLLPPDRSDAPDSEGNGRMPDCSPADATTSILTILGYSMGSRHKPGTKNSRPLVAAHTDVGVLTFLLFDAGTCATLQRHMCAAEFSSPSTERDSEEVWVDVCLPSSVPIDPIFVVNVADCLSELSEGRLPSTLHRVAPNRVPPLPRRGAQRHGNSQQLPPPLTPRTCCALFVGLRPQQSLLMRGERVSYEDWRKVRISRALRVLKAS